MLKVYSNTSVGDREAEAQRRAFEIISSSGRADLAVVPKMYFSGEIKIKNKSVADLVESEGVVLNDGNVELILMDFVEGDDLAVYLYKRVCEFHPGLVDLKERIEKGDKIDVGELSDRVGFALDFIEPENRQDDFQSRRADNSNHKKMVDYLYSRGFVMDQSFIEKIDKTVSLWHENGLRHNDLHERNIIVQEIREGGINPVIVDFGSSLLSEQRNPVSGREGNFLDDNYIRGAYLKLTRSKEEREKNRVHELFLNASSDVSRHKIEYTALLGEILNIVDFETKQVLGQVLKKIDNFILRAMSVAPYDIKSGGAERFWKAKAFILYKLAELRPNLAGEISDHVNGSKIKDRYAAGSIPIKNFLVKVTEKIRRFGGNSF